MALGAGTNRNAEDDENGVSEGSAALGFVKLAQKPGTLECNTVCNYRLIVVHYFQLVAILDTSHLWDSTWDTQTYTSLSAASCMTVYMQVHK